MVDVVIYDEEPVVRVLEDFHLDCRILGVVLVDVQLEGLANLHRVDSGRDPGSALVQHCKDRVIYVIVNKDNPGLRLADPVSDEGVGIIGLAIEEDSLANRFVLLKLQSSVRFRVASCQACRADGVSGRWRQDTDA